MAIIGYSGSGKTTLLNLLGLLDKPDEDCHPEIRFYENDGKKVETNKLPLADMNKFRRRHFGFIFQEGYISPPETAQKPFVNLVKFLAKFALSDIFPKAGKHSNSIGKKDQENPNLVMIW
ncbi:lipoprotein ABC transporter ATP-binding protein [Candidatus Magnetomorum sp. HK-1]|nr:lipoprotein ABC transporter ATP-binding protein [Candidatus Magnetomorum sp. HK-1]